MIDDNYVLMHIEELCKKNQWSKYELSIKSGLSQSTISNLFNRTNQPTFTTLSKICDAFGITLSQFFEPFNYVDLSKDQEEILSIFSKLSERDKKIVKIIIKQMVSIEN